jgi:hypothetical protein
MKLKYFTDANDYTVCLVRVDNTIEDFRQIFFLMRKDTFYSVKNTDDTIEIDEFGVELFSVAPCQANLWSVKAYDDGTVQIYAVYSLSIRCTASCSAFATDVDMKVVKQNGINLGIILPDKPNVMLYPDCNHSTIVSLVANRSIGHDKDDKEDKTEEGPNEDVTMSDDLCLISTSDKTRFLKELSSRQKSGYELCNMTTSCIQVDGKLQVVFSSLLKAKEDKKND